MKSLLEKAGLNSFFFCLIGAIVFAYLKPEWAGEASPVPLDNIAYWGVTLIFFFYGLKLNFQKLKEGLMNWKMHILIQCITFIVFPVLVLIFKTFFYTDTYSQVWLGIFYLAALPSTVSSSVVMISIAKGNIPAGIFNASISSILGIFITPVWMTAVMDKVDGDMDMASVLTKLCIQVLVPIILGLLLNRYLGGFAGKYKKLLGQFDQLIILIIVFNSFGESFANKVFEPYSIQFILVLAACMMALFFLVYSLSLFASRKLGFNDADTVTVIFCGSKKSLVQGAVMGAVLFGHSNNLGVILLPIMLYHALQLMAGSAIAQRMALMRKD
ncbi:bile acid:sodium symporter family protein [Polluticaenibacter yanchengensis]|uniref:Bile acid:sodium symporter n=1 Tax=Polluticaenibacter yanchengensis TaxID=3014562 RepID=A0ABT4UP52_9BACT|nr:bile acid:sodium symporter [Chitinophagaceae bacterium LY-5]